MMLPGQQLTGEEYQVIAPSRRDSPDPVGIELRNHSAPSGPAVIDETESFAVYLVKLSGKTCAVDGLTLTIVARKSR
jgi:hypothetical protein